MTTAMAMPRRIHFDRLERGAFVVVPFFDDFAAACSRSRCSRISRRESVAPVAAATAVAEAR